MPLLVLVLFLPASEESLLQRALPVYPIRKAGEVSVLSAPVLQQWSQVLNKGRKGERCKPAWATELQLGFEPSTCLVSPAFN